MSEKSKAKPFGTEGAIRFDGQRYWFLNRQSQGWASFGYWYASLEELLSRWAVRLGKQQADEYGPYWPYELGEEGE